MEDEVLRAPCWAGQQAVGTVMGTMFGFVSAALLTPTKGEATYQMPAAPGAVLGSALGVIAVNSSGERNQPGFVCALLAISSAALTTYLLYSIQVVCEVLIEGGSAGVMMLAGVASLASTMVFAVRNCSMLRAVRGEDNRRLLSQAANLEAIYPKEV